MKKIICLIALLAVTRIASAQVTEIGSFPSSADSLNSSGKHQISLPAAKKWDYGIQLGTSVTFAGRYGSALSTSVSPHFSWQPTARFRLNAGVSIVNTTLFGYKPYHYGYETGSPLDGNYTHALVYVEGQYLLSKNLMVSGSLYADVPLTGSNPNNPWSTSSFKGASMDLQYHIGRNATIQAGFSIINSQGPYYYDPFRPTGSMFYDPFGTGYSNPFSH
jgi:hypothetical protein